MFIADSYTNSLQLYTDTMASLIEYYGQPHQLALRRIADLMTLVGKWYALRVRALVGMLDQFGDSGQTELNCGSHVTKLLSKLPQDMREVLVPYASYHSQPFGLF